MSGTSVRKIAHFEQKNTTFTINGTASASAAWTFVQNYFYSSKYHHTVQSDHKHWARKYASFVSKTRRCRGLTDPSLSPHTSIIAIALPVGRAAPATNTTIKRNTCGESSDVSPEHLHSARALPQAHGGPQGHSRGACALRSLSPRRQ